MTPRERFLRACRGERVDRPPVWLMRQAGRYLPEYRELRDATSFEERVSRPDLAAELTLQPTRRFPLDAAILFSDILVPLAGMGRRATYPAEGGPVVQRPIRTPEDVNSLRAGDETRDAPFVVDSILRVRKELPKHALLGFAGAPFTLASYLIEGRTSRSFQETKRFCYHYPGEWHTLATLCAQTATQYLRAQVDAGCDAVQLFDTWAETLAPQEYERLALPYVRQVFRALRDLDVPLIYFARGTPHLLAQLPATEATVWSLDWRVQLDTIRQSHPRVALQGNLDPTLLFAPPESIRTHTKRMLDSLHGHAHIANLGHGILPGTPIEGVNAFVGAVNEWSA